MKPPQFWRSQLSFGASRALRPSDAAACAVLHASSFAHPWSVLDFETLLTEPACCGDGIDSKNELTGFIVSRRALDEAEILTLVVDPRTRRHGCGQRLLTSHLSRLSGLGVTSLFLEVDQANAAALTLYRRHGFVEKGVRKGYYAKSDGTRADALVMRRSLA